MDNTTDLKPTAPSEGQPQSTQAQVPNSDASGQNPTSGAVDGATTPTESGQANQGFTLPEKFQGKSAEEIAQEYVKLESYNKKIEMDKAELSKMFIEQPAEPQQYQAAAQESTEEDPMAALRPMLQDEFGKLLSPVIAKIEVEEAVRKYGDDFVKLAPQVSELKKQNKSLSLETAYKIVAFDNIQRTAMNQGAAQATKAQEQAQRAQLESSKPSGIRPMGIEEAATNKNVPMTDVLEAMGPEMAPFLAKYKEKQNNRRR
jgi:hypothetical protein